MFIVIVFGVLLIIGIAYVYKKVKAFKASTAYEELEEAFNKVKEAEKAKDEAKKTLEETRKVMHATPEYKDYLEAWDAVKATPEYKASDEALYAYQKVNIAYLEADLDWENVKRSAKSTLKEEMEEEAW